MMSRKIAGTLLLLVLLAVALSAGEIPLPQTQGPAEQGTVAPQPATGPAQALPVEPAPALPPLDILDTARYTACTCEGQCGMCGGRLRGCFNGFPICECFQC